ncbi:MAG TPA: hypothetical protein VIP11_10760 [Gemmatimonadaceae bacterium]
MSRRALWETVSELAESMRPVGEAAHMLRITRLGVTMPIELAARSTHDGDVEILADAPRWRWSTPFDARPGRLTIEMTSANELLEELS